MAAAIPFIMVAATVASTAYSIMETRKAGKEREADAERAAVQSTKAAEQLASDTEKQHRRIIASQAARYGAAGVTAEGSPLLVKQQSLLESKEQLRRIHEAGATQSENLLAEGREALRVGEAEGIKSLLGGAATVGQMGRNYQWW